MQNCKPNHNRVVEIEVTKMKQEKSILLSCYFSSPPALRTLLHLLFCLSCLILPTFTVSTIPLSNETDRIALLDFKHHISYDPHGVLVNSWNDSVHHCDWPGVRCGRRHRRVVALELPGKGLVGTISPHIGNLTFLGGFDLSANGIHGGIPSEIGRLFRLRYLNLSINALTGELAAVNLSSCLQLRVVNFYQNGLHGKLPVNLVYLQELLLLNLGDNQLTGEIPPAFGNFSSFRVLALLYNHLEGSIPHEIAKVWGLKALSLAANNLSGSLPSAFFNKTSITYFSVTANSLQGTIPSDIGDTMPNLKDFFFGANKFHGTIPVSFPNASKLQNLELSQNHFVGKVPGNLGMLKDLQRLNLELNLLGGNDPLTDLDFIASLSNCSNLNVFSIHRNRFEGKLPDTIANLSSNLSLLFLGWNKLSGPIPVGIKNLVGLTGLHFGGNFLSGVIPGEIGELQKLQKLYLGTNQFSGKIPPSLFNLTSLFSLYMDNNNLDGNIPSSVGNFWNLNELVLSSNRLTGTIPQQVFDLPSLSKYLDLSSNSFTGLLSPAIGKLKTLNVLDVPGNKLSGKIPEAIGDCLSLEYLDLHANLFQGKIPPSLVSLKNIKYLDLSNNKLNGEIPRDLQKLPLLQYLNLSFNDLEGEVPTSGIFAKANNVSLVGNKKLCGGVPELKLPPCLVKKRKHRKHIKLMVLIFTCVGVALVFASFLSLHLRKDKREKSTKLCKVEKLSMITYCDLHQAIGGFSDINLIGTGSFGSVFKGRFEQGEEQLVAIKVFDLLKNGASRSFFTECNVLKNIRHRNLVPILTSCSSCDASGNEFKALVYEFMENGDLDTWLHPHSCDGGTRFLSVVQRLNIAIDVASALHYLHDDCESTVIHCDLKPSNILLDKNLVAHVGDFGISRLYSQIVENSSREQTFSIGLKGSIGYVPPEYGMGAHASTLGDVYSFGILLLEMFTAKRPVDDLFNDGCSCLYDYVEIALSKQVMEIVDPLLLACLESQHGTKPDEEVSSQGNLVGMEENKMHNFFISIFKIGLTCASRSPMDRMYMNDVTRELHKIKRTFCV
ncbi:putative receptor-like protein kinase At3g47110 [Ipomoea triloba]|uniref:putative receptor-like protein kinase At3g47110 n=1 Tax=Ipomoea triloba TaxID=35885 RepID=UPI00125D140C|nr:putative receptor-like protein kinase At3g47110 [Ipomoea triloba]